MNVIQYEENKNEPGNCTILILGMMFYEQMVKKDGTPNVKVSH